MNDINHISISFSLMFLFTYICTILELNRKIVMIKNLLFILLVLSIAIIQACTYDNLDEPEFCDTVTATYDLNVKAIIDASCAYVGCHLDNVAIGDFSTHAGMISRSDNGLIETRVITQKDDPVMGMPPDYATGPKDLTQEELDIITCWLEAGAPL